MDDFTTEELKLIAEALGYIETDYGVIEAIPLSARIANEIEARGETTEH